MYMIFGFVSWSGQLLLFRRGRGNIVNRFRDAKTHFDPQANRPKSGSLCKIDFKFELWNRELRSG